MIELLRRLVLLACFLTGLGLAWYASLEPLVIVKPVEGKKAEDAASRDTGSGLGSSLLAEADRARRARDDRIVVDVEGPQWGSFFTSVVAATEGKLTSYEWKRRLPSDSHPMAVLFFRPDESPINALAGYFRPGGPRFLVRFGREARARYLEIDYRTYSDESFHFGSGLSSYPHPPRYLLYPYRTMGLWVVLAGLLFYFVLPTAKKPAGALRYTRWRICLGDLAGYAFTIMPIALPVLVVGGTVQGLTRGWPLLLLFGAIIPLGIYSLYVSTWLASFQVLARDADLEIATFRGRRSFRYSDMNFFQPVIFRPPRWLITLSWIMVLASAGAAQVGATGRAVLLSSSEASSIAITMKTGGTVFINISDQMGGTALDGFGALLKKLEAEGVRKIRDPREVRSLGFETVRM